MVYSNLSFYVIIKEKKNSLKVCVEIISRVVWFLFCIHHEKGEKINNNLKMSVFITIYCGLVRT